MDTQINLLLYTKSKVNYLTVKNSGRGMNRKSIVVKLDTYEELQRMGSRGQDFDGKISDLIRVKKEMMVA